MELWQQRTECGFDFDSTEREENRGKERERETIELKYKKRAEIKLNQIDKVENNSFGTKTIARIAQGERRGETKEAEKIHTHHI